MANRFINFFVIGILFLLAVWVLTLPETTRAATDASKMLLVKDGAGMGRDIYIPKEPKRIIILTAASFDMWMNLGGAESLVGVPNFIGVERSLYKKLGPKTELLGSYAYRSPEKILALAPDLVIATGFEGVQNILGEFLQRANIPLLTLPSRSVEDTYNELRMYGYLLKHPEKAEVEIERIKKNIEKKTKEHEKKAQKSVLLVFGTSASFSMLLPYSRQGNLLELAGGRNVVEQKYGSLEDKHIPLSLEYAALQKPDYVFFVNHGRHDVMIRKTKEALEESSAWNTVKAVREGRVHVLPSELFVANPGLKTDDAICYISDILNSEEKYEKN